MGAALVLAALGFAVFAPVLSGRDPLLSDFRWGIDRSTDLPVGPSARFWLGTDRLFRDQLARLAAGARLSLTIGIMSTLLATAIGTAVGMLAGWFHGERGIRIPALTAVGAVFGAIASLYTRPTLALVCLGASGVSALIAARRPRSYFARGFYLDLDAVLMRGVDIGLSFPFLLLVMAIGAAVDKTSTSTIFIVLGLTGWLGTARLVRAKTMQLRRFEFIDAARALGNRPLAILLHHVLPNVMGPIIVIATAQVAQMILAESVLSYLGAGVTPPTPTWGGMLSDGQDYFSVAPWLVLAPAAAILITVLGFNLLGEGLRDAFDPRAERR